MTSVHECLVPDIGDFEDVEVIEILVRPGETVEVEQPLVTLESDKASMELPAPVAGAIVEVFVVLGDKVSEGTRLLSIDSSPDASAAADVGGATDDVRVGGLEVARALSPELEKPLEGESDPVAILKAPPASTSHASPSVRRLAGGLGVDLARVSGSGRKGRILKEDVQQFVKRALAEVPAQTAPAGAFQLPAMPDIDFSKYGEVEVQPLNKIRRSAARNLHRSWITVPHVTQFDEADITELEEFRRSRSAQPEPGGAKLTILVFLMKSLTVALRDFPMFNASLDKSGESLILKKYFHIGIAVDTENGLVVPVIRGVDTKGLVELSEELSEISQRARDRKLGPEDMSGASITISSLGGIGGTAFTPIVNAPEVAILGVSRSQIKPVYRDGSFVPRLLLPLSLSYDHRVIDGAVAVRFTTRLKAVLADIRHLLL